MSSEEGGVGGCSAKADRGWSVLFNRIKSGIFKIKVLLREVIKETAVQHLKRKKKEWKMPHLS